MRIVAFFAFLCALAFAPAHAKELITSYVSDITINKDTSVSIKETIAINVEGRDIRRGIIRTYPTRYKTEGGDTVTVGLTVESISRDGRNEPYWVSDFENGIEIHIGDEDVLLPHGVRTYVISYRATFLLGHFEETDEFYYNVLGLDSPYETLDATAIIRLPPGARPGQMAVWTGAGGMKLQNATIAETEPGVITVRSTQPLAEYEGITVAVEWPIGFVDRPGAADYFFRWLTANAPAWLGLGGLLAMLGVLYSSWRRWGKDPERGVIIPLFEPPEGIEPAEARFVTSMGYDNKIFAAAIVNMGVKGAIRIEEDSSWFNKTITLHRTGEGAEKLTATERLAYDRLFSRGDAIEMKQDNWQVIKSANDSLKTKLEIAHQGTTFHTNQGAVGAAILVPIVAGLGIWATGGENTATFVGVGVLVVGALGLLILFSNLMKAPTVPGQALRDRIDGFRMFLDTAEKERWEVLNPPKMTPQLFEKYLPYALALGVDHTWSQTFEREMRIQQPGENYNYRPRWYSGRNFSGVGAGALSHSISNAMTSAISSSSSPPGKSSGFRGGGGFSGGGGGGGGVRGW